MNNAIFSITKLDKIKFIKPEIGYFPSLQNYVRHGFSWGNELDMSMKQSNKNLALKNNQDFFGSVGLGSLASSLIISAEHLDDIVFVNNENLRFFSIGEFAIPIKCDALFTNITNLPISIRVADCATAIIYCQKANNERITGIVHTGRRSAELLLAKKSIQFLNQNGFQTEDIRIGIAPSIASPNYKFPNLESISPENWENFIMQKGDHYELDVLNFVIKQYIDTGIKQNNIEIYDVDTYESARNKESFSHRYYMENKDINLDLVDGRFILATSL